jgi:4-hydroxybenzoate polyprenyltransferase
VWYVVPIFSFRLREISLLKAPLVALVWTGILIVFPQLESVHFTPHFIAFALAFFCYFLALTIPFDVRDLSLDATTQNTIPMVLGVKKSRWLAVLLLVASALIIANINENSWLMFLLVPSYAITAVFIFCSNEYRKEAFYAGLDATMVLVGIAFYLVS